MRSLSGRVLIVIGSLLSAIAAEPKSPPTPPEGSRPTGTDGKPLNLDFETGTLRDWTAEGDAFRGQPIKGDTVARRRGDMKSRHQGDYWIGGYELQGDRPQGTLTSVPFQVTYPWASFLIGGGPWPETCVELVRSDKRELISRTSGREEEDMRRIAIDLRPHLGKTIFIRLVDKHSGHWGHVNFDDFRFHSEKPNLPVPTGPIAADVYKHAGLPPMKAAAAMTVPEGFDVKLFAGEPDVRQPIALCLDDRGRLWVAEAYSYPIRRPDKEAKDRILIFEDTDGDGRFDRRTVFMEGLNLVSGLEVGFGGVWIGAAPYFLFVPVKAGEDRPAGRPQILLDGWHYEDTHETLNSFCWGPDGWLYGCHGVFTHSRVGKPGTPDNVRVPINAGVWRYHPTRHVFEVFAHGTSNPWGLDFDVHGQAFVEACVIPHAFHMIQGGRYQRQAGAHFNPHTYADIQTIADHLHWQGANPWAGNSRSDSAGGGHAHCGLMIYQGGAWPAEYRGQLFMGNVHGHRLNMDVPKPKGSGFVASHGPDFLLANDAWSRFINLRYGPDGNVYLLDWYDKQACHHHDPKIWDRENGRIYTVCYRGTKPVKVDLARKPDQELVALQRHPNEWFVRHARRLLQERAASKTLDHGTHEALEKIAFGEGDESWRLRALWALHATGGLTDERILRGLSDKAPYIRAWTVQLALEQGAPSATIAARLVELAQRDDSPVVRLYLASAAQRLLETVGSQISNLAAALTAHGEDGADPNLPLMYWYALEAEVSRLGPKELGNVSRMYETCRIPLLREFLVRRVASFASPEALHAVVALLSSNARKPAEKKLLLRNILIGLKGRRQVDKPANWDNLTEQQALLASDDVELRSLARSLAAVFGDSRAFRQLRLDLVSSQTDLSTRQAALTTLLDARDKDLPPLLQRLLGEKALRGAALRGLAFYDDPRTPDLILSKDR
jgi:putative membrane-bound dehydrogenase-like protein